MRRWLLVALAGALWAAPASAETCDDHAEGPPPKTFPDFVRWDAGVRGEVSAASSIGGRVAAEYSIIPNVDLGARVDYGYEKGGVQTVILSLEARVYPLFKIGGTGANVCGYKMRVWTYSEESRARVLLSGAPYLLLSIGGGLDLAPDVSAAWNGRVGAGWEFYLARTAALFVEAGGALGAMNGLFGSLGIRF